MMKGRLGGKLIIFIIFVCTFFVLGSSLALAKDTCQVIRLDLVGNDIISITPKKIVAEVDTCTVWVNFMEELLVEVSFRENARACKLSSKSSSGFVDEFGFKDGKECYLTEPLPRGASASLFWHLPGTYKYTIEVVQSRIQRHLPIKTAQGVIEVK